MNSHVAIVIANWNGKKMLEQTLRALSAQTVPADRVIVVDNGSTDGSLELLTTDFSWVQVIPLPENTGYAYANNKGISEALRDPAIQFIITLNNDTTVDARYIEEMLACAERHPEAGAIQAKIVNFYTPERIDCVGIEVHWDMSAMNKGQAEADHGQYETEQEVFGASASAALYTREALEKIRFSTEEYFDNSYFAYYEDVDLAWRLRLAGYSSWYTPRALVRHIHSATGKSHSPFKAFHIHRNHYYNIIKNAPLLFLIRALAFMPLRYVLLVTSLLRKKGPSAELSKQSHGRGSMASLVVRSWGDIIRMLPALLRKRGSIQKKRSVSLVTISSWFNRFHASLYKSIYGNR